MAPKKVLSLDLQNHLFVQVKEDFYALRQSFKKAKWLKFEHQGNLSFKQIEQETDVKLLTGIGQTMTTYMNQYIFIIGGMKHGTDGRSDFLSQVCFLDLAD